MALTKLTPYMCNIRNLSITPSLLKTSPSNKGEIPKKPPTPWSSYYGMEFPEVKRRNPNLPSAEIMRMISGKWKMVPEEEKNRLQEMYEKEKKAYRAQMDKLPEEVLQKAKESRKEAKELKKGRKAASELKKLNEELKKPKRNLNPYLIFSNDRRSTLAATMKASDVVKALAQEWLTLPSDLKEKYEMKARQDKERYISEMELWNAKIADDGNEEQISKLKKSKSASKKRNKD